MLAPCLSDHFYMNTSSLNGDGDLLEERRGKHPDVYNDQ